MNEHHNGPHHEKHVFYFGTHKLQAPRERMKVSEVKDIIASHVADFKREHVLVLAA
jgi:hypothetical protein